MNKITDITLSRNTQSGVFVALILVATIVRIYDLGAASIWLDEAYTFDFSWLGTTPYTEGSAIPNVFFMIEYVFLQFGNNEFILRLPSVLFGVLTIIVIFIATRKVGGFWAALVAATILTFSIPHLEYSQEARHYQTLNFFISLGFLGLIQLTQNKSIFSDNSSCIIFLRSGALLYGVSLLLALYTHIIAVFFALAAQIFFLAYWTLNSRFHTRIIVYWIALNAILFALFFPLFLSSASTVVDGEQFTWLSQFEPAHALSIVGSVHSVSGIWALNRDVDNLFLALINLPFVALAVLGLWRHRSNISLVVLVLSLLVSSSILTWAFGLIKPIFMFRTVLWGSLISAFLIGLGFSQLGRKLASAYVVLLALFSVSNVYIYFQTDRAENENWRAAVEQYSLMQQRDDILMFCMLDVSRPFFYYVDDHSAAKRIFGWDSDIKKLRMGKLANSDSPYIVKWGENYSNVPLVDRKRLNQQLWIIDSHCKDHEESGFSAIEKAGWHQSSEFSFRGLVLLHRYIPGDLDNMKTGDVGWTISTEL